MLDRGLSHRTPLRSLRLMGVVGPKALFAKSSSAVRLIIVTVDEGG